MKNTSIYSSFFQICKSLWSICARRCMSAPGSHQTFYFGRESNTPIDLVYGPPPVEDFVEPVDYVKHMTKLLQDAYALVRQNLGIAAKRRKRQYDPYVRVKRFHVGD